MMKHITVIFSLLLPMIAFGQDISTTFNKLRLGVFPPYRGILTTFNEPKADEPATENVLFPIYKGVIPKTCEELMEHIDLIWQQKQLALFVLEETKKDMAEAQQNKDQALSAFSENASGENWVRLQEANQFYNTISDYHEQDRSRYIKLGAQHSLRSAYKFAHCRNNEDIASARASTAASDENQ